MVKKRRKRKNCPNCGYSLAEDMNYCPNCGQENHIKKVPMRVLVADFFRDYLSFDSKFFHSIIPLLVRPGFLTKEFNKGKRISYFPPVRMYLFISIVYFFVFSLYHAPGRVGDTGENEDKIINIGTDSVTMANIKGMIDEHGLENAYDSLGADNMFDRIIIRQSYKMSKFGDAIFFKNLQKNTSILMFFLLPVFAGLLKLFYRKNKRYYIEHLIHSFHIHSFLFLFWTLFLLLGIIYDPIYRVWMPVLAFYVYAVISMRKVYGRSIFRTISKSLGIFLFYMLAFTVFFGITGLLSFLLF